MNISSAYVSEQGPVRTINADAVLADDANCFYAIADGIGSTVGSAEASQFLVGEAHRQFKRTFEELSPLEPETLIESLIAPYAKKFGSHPKTPGSTLSVAWVFNETLYYSSVGDSPIFLIDEGRAQLLTREHTAADRNQSISSFSDLKSLSGSNILARIIHRNSVRLSV